jgi:tetratricopeptide (TPR) repeat protein
MELPMKLKLLLLQFIKICTAAALLLLLMGCPTVNGRSERHAVFQGLADGESPLAYAVYAAEFIDDGNKKLDIYFSTAEAYAAHRWYAQADFVLEKASFLVRDKGLADGNPRLLIRIARLYALAQRPAEARELFERSLDEIHKLDEDWLKGHYLRSIIDFCLTRLEDFPEIFRRAIESVYIIQNITVRATVLLDIITLYRELGNNFSVDNLLQQTFSAAASITDPGARIEIFSRIALVYVRNGEQEEAREMIERLLEEIEIAEDEREAGQELPGLIPAADGTPP